MAAFFFDSSALVKLHVDETGSTWTKAIADPSADNRLYIARLAGVEVVSAITRRRVSGAISIEDAVIALADFRRDLTSADVIIEIDAQLIAHAMSLAERHALRAYDAVQLAAALELSRQRLVHGASMPVLVPADAALNSAAATEGLIVDDPNVH